MPEEKGPVAKGKKVRKRDKKQRTGRKHESRKIWEYFKGEKKKACPRCGPGTFLAGHKDRLYCGKCGYTEFYGKEKQKTA